jgi:hypothetical protein
VAGVSGFGVEAGVVMGDTVGAALEAGVALGVEEGELEGCPPEGAGGCCSHPATSRMAKAKITTKILVTIRRISTHEPNGYSSRV